MYVLCQVKDNWDDVSEDEQPAETDELAGMYDTIMRGIEGQTDRGIDG